MPSTSHPDRVAAQIVFAIGEPARARMLYSLLDGKARTSTELSVLASVSPSTASSHLKKLRQSSLLKLHVQGKHHYYSLRGHSVASLLESLNVIATSRNVFVSRTPRSLRFARRCYDHLAGRAGVGLCDSLVGNGWLQVEQEGDAFQVTKQGNKAFTRIGLNLPQIQRSKRRFAYSCLDWSERRPHLAGALASALLKMTLEKRWLVSEEESRVLHVTASGKRELNRILGLSLSGDLYGSD